MHIFCYFLFTFSLTYDPFQFSSSLSLSSDHSPISKLFLYLSSTTISQLVSKATNNERHFTNSSKQLFHKQVTWVASDEFMNLMEMMFAFIFFNKLN